MIFLVCILTGLLVPVISVALLLLLNFVFVLNVLGLLGMFLVIDSLIFFIVLSFILVCFFIVRWLVDSMF